MHMKRGSGWRRQAVVAALVAGLFLAGCSGGDEPAEPAAQPVTSIPEGRLPEPVPVMPAAAREHTLDGAEAMMRYYLDVYGYAFTMSDSSGLKPISDKRCAFCSTAIQWVDENAQYGYRGDGGRFSVGDAEASWFTRDKVALITAQARQTSGRMLSKDGAVLSTSSEVQSIMTFKVEWASDRQGWRVIDVRVSK